MSSNESSPSPGSEREPQRHRLRSLLPVQRVIDVQIGMRTDDRGGRYFNIWVAPPYRFMVTRRALDIRLYLEY